MPQKLIDGVQIKPLKLIPDERGTLAELLRADDALFRKFGQVYFTTVYPGVVKAWHYHKIQYDHFACVHGMIKLGLYDDREKSSTKGVVNEFFLGMRHPILVQIPPLVWHGFKGASVEEAVVINVSTEPYVHASPDEYRRPWNDPAIPYDWERKNG
ncbi:MAG: dTDP-4-dehydrorhamnose 3,5-epimerase family protein [Planctomycetes bacterium]|nr:dTDP-4-dehydrorhamnose 3,5-epimerase family protein [Planctomycetota bacterium]